MEGRIDPTNPLARCHRPEAALPHGQIGVSTGADPAKLPPGPWEVVSENPVQLVRLEVDDADPPMNAAGHPDLRSTRFLGAGRVASQAPRQHRRR